MRISPSTAWLRAATPMERGQVALLLALALLTLGAWVLTVHQARTMDMPMGVAVRSGVDPDLRVEMANGMPDMPMEAPVAGEMHAMAASGMSGMGWTWEGFLTFLGVWAVMMAAMMFPAAAPMLLLYHGVVSRRTGAGSGMLPTWVFAAGYLAVWTTIGAATWVLIRIASDLASRLDVANRAAWAPLALGIVLVAAGLYQFTPLKAVCLRHCQSPLGFVMTHWRDGHRGALRMGLAHGVYCVGCCWSLFAVLVAAGVMSLAWMLVLTLVVFAEKAVPLGVRGTYAIGAVLVLLGLLVSTGATSFPWAT